MEFKPFSKKKLKVLTWWCESSKYKNYDAIICDGAVRSGKTMCMSLSFILWAFYYFSDSDFAMCGKTLTSIKRNCIKPLMPIIKSLGFKVSEVNSKNYIEISKGGIKNRFYFFGGKDEASASLIQGMTLSGVMLDEVALMPRSFVEQALARCSVENSKFWFNCNPENPGHWFNQEWILKKEQKNVLYIHFLMEDNPSLSKAIINRYRSLYSDAFYERFVMGKWTATNGLVYPFFSNADICKKMPNNFSKYYISIDYGTVNPTSMGLWAEHKGVYYRIDEYYYSSKKYGEQKTDEEYYLQLEKLAGNRKIEQVIVDPSAASFITCIKRHNRFKVKAAKNDVLDGIRLVCDALKNGKIVICQNCKDIIREFSLYRWDNSSSKDAPQKANDHAMDDMRYFVSTVLSTTQDEFYAIAADRTG